MLHPNPDPQDSLKQKLTQKMGQVNAIASQAKGTARKLKEAAEHHQQHADYDVQQLAGRIQSAGIGNDPEAEQAYCHRLMERHRMGQAYELAAHDEARFPDLEAPEPGKLVKSLHRLRPEAVHHDYQWGSVQPVGAPEPDDFEPRLYDPQELLPREIERDKDPEKVEYFRQLFNREDPQQIDPVVLVRTEKGREILDGHHRALGAKEADRMLRAVEVGEGTFDRLRGAGFSDSDIAYAVLACSGCWNAADNVKSQYDGKSVRRSGYLAYEHITKDVGEGNDESLAF